MPGQKISGIALGAVGTGSVVLYAGIKGKDLPSVVRDIIGGKNPHNAPDNAKIAQVAEQATAAQPVPGATGTSGGAPSTSAKANQALARLSVALTHPDWAVGQQWADWVALWDRESGWNSLIQNPGSGAFGIAQALGHGTDGAAAVVATVYYPGGATAHGVTVNQYPSKAANSGSALAQIQWGIDYIAQRYGSPSAAMAHENSAGWY